jgi:hypothetical protein
MKKIISLSVACLGVWNLNFAVALAKTVGVFAAPDKSFELKVDTVPTSDKTGDKSEDNGIVLNKLISLMVKIVPKDAAATTAYGNLEFDAVMPAHNHGMVVRPKITEITPNEFRIDGVKLHMAGDWSLLFSLQVNGQPVKIAVPYNL